MENKLFKHLTFLLPTHNCVIIPDLGAFIVNMENAKINMNGSVTPPHYFVAFNPELKTNDGLIASLISKNENISYKVALAKIKEDVKNVLADLKSGKTIDCGILGNLAYDELNNIIFLPNKSYIHPDCFGLYQTTLDKLSDIRLIENRKKRNVSLRYTLTGAAAATVALFLLFAPSNSIKNDHNYQSAGFVSSISTSLLSEEAKAKMDNVNQLKKIGEQKSENNPVVMKTIPTHSYYIVIGGEETKGMASRLLEKITTSDFPDAKMIESPNRYRIYIAKFDNKIEAEGFLDIFRSENPAYSTAWLYSKRNR